MKKIIVFASGTATNLLNIINYFKNKPVEVSLIVSNKPHLGSYKIASDNNIPLFELKNNWDPLVKEVLDIKPNLIVLAGFLLKVPEYFIKSIDCQIINIHPSLLPKYGGKGMYGDNVHQSVIESGERKSGITIHFVNEKYDDGKIIFQKEIELDENTTIEQLKSKIRDLEWKNFPEIIERLLNYGL